MIRRLPLLVVFVTSCAAPVVNVPSASTAPTTSPTASPSAAATASPSAAPSPATRAFAGAGLETFAVGRLSGEIALLIRPVQPKGDPLSSTDSRELWIVPLDGRAPTLAVRFRTPKVSNTIDANALDRQLSPDGRRVVLSVGIGEIEVASQLEIIDLETGRVTPVAPGGGPLWEDTYPAWSPDGALIAFVRWPHALGSGSRELWVIGADGRNARRIRPAPGAGTFIRLFTWLPDSRRIAFDPINFESSMLAVIDLDGTERVRRAEQLNAGDPGGLPVAFRSRAPVLALTTFDSSLSPTRYDLVVADDIGASARIVATVKPDATTGVFGLAAPRWDPSGANALLYRLTGVGSTTVVLDLATGASVRIGSRVRAADWSPDGKRIVTIEEHPSTANDALYVWTRDGQLVRERVDLPGEPLIYRLTDLAVRSY